MEPKCDGALDADGVAACVAGEQDFDSGEHSTISDGFHGTKRTSLDDTANRGFNRRQPCTVLTTERVQEFGPTFARNINGWHYAPPKCR
jgi:hypothetical protein